MLDHAQRDAYAADGYVSPVRVMSEGAARGLRERIEALERDHPDGAGGHALAQLFRVNGQLVIPLLADIARVPGIVDAVGCILGPDLLVWSVELFIKEPGSAATVSWHQDITYWGMGETDEEATAWLALTDVSVEAGCMRFVPGSHANGVLAHEDTFGDGNMLSRGQTLPGVDEARARHGPLAPGEISIHHGRCFHASGPNRSADRRIGVAIRYVTPGVRQSAGGRDYAMLVKGRDAEAGWIHVAPPLRLFDPDALALYDEVLAAQTAVLAAGAEGRTAGYGGAA